MCDIQVYRIRRENHFLLYNTSLELGMAAFEAAHLIRGWQWRAMSSAAGIVLAYPWALEVAFAGAIVPSDNVSHKRIPLPSLQFYWVPPPLPLAKQWFAIG